MSPPARYSFKTRPVAHPEAIVAGDNYRFTVLTDGLLRAEWAEDGRFEDRASTFAVTRRLALPDFYVWDRPNLLEIHTTRVHLVYNKKKFSPKGFVVHLKNGPKSKWYYGKRLSNLGGTTRTLDGVNGRTTLGPGVLSRDGIAVLDDSKTMLFERDGWIAPRKEGSRSDMYIFAYGHDYRDAIHAFYAVSGSQPLLPRFALGNWWSRYHRYDEEEYLELQNHLDADDVPINVAVVDMDWHLVRPGSEIPAGENGWTGYTWNKALFPDPDAFIQKLHDRGLKVSLNVHPADGIRHWEDQYKQVARYMGIDPSSKEPVHFDCTDKRFVDAYFDIVHHQHEARGIDFWWIDWQQGEGSKIPGVDPLWVLNHFHFLDAGRSSQRPLIFSRFGGPGAQRYQVGFSGDSIITWDSLHFQPEFTATASNIGYAWWSHDIGGHTHGIHSDELTTRWVQLGCWSPLLRLHSDVNPFNSREPWRYNAEACTIIEETLRLRHRLIPYLYTMNARSATADDPLVSPLYWDFPEEENAYAYPNMYRFGSSLLCAPITQPRDNVTRLGKADAWLPPAHRRYADLFTGAVYDGGCKHTFHRPLSQTPVLAPEGAIIPLDAERRPRNGSPNPSYLEILLIVGADGAFELIEDDGTGTGVEDGGFEMVSYPRKSSEDEDEEEEEGGWEKVKSDEPVRFVHTPIVWKQKEGVLKIGPVWGEGEGCVPSGRRWRVRTVGYTIPSDDSDGMNADGMAGEVTCVVKGHKGKETAMKYSVKSTDAGSVIDIADNVPTAHTLTLHIPTCASFSSASSSKVEEDEGPQLDVTNPLPTIWNVLDQAQMDLERKRWIWDEVFEKEGWGPERMVERLKEMGVEENLRGAFTEGLQGDGRWRGGGR